MFATIQDLYMRFGQENVLSAANLDGLDTTDPVNIPAIEERIAYFLGQAYDQLTSALRQGSYNPNDFFPPYPQTLVKANCEIAFIQLYRTRHTEDETVPDAYKTIEENNFRLIRDIQGGAVRFDTNIPRAMSMPTVTRSSLPGFAVTPQKVRPPARVNGILPDINGNIVIDEPIKSTVFDSYVNAPYLAVAGKTYVDVDTGRWGFCYVGSNGLNRFLSITGGGGEGTDDYRFLSNKPSINGVIVDGSQTGSDFGLADALTVQQLSETTSQSITDLQNNKQDAVLSVAQGSVLLADSAQRIAAAQFPEYTYTTNLSIPDYSISKQGDVVVTVGTSTTVNNLGAGQHGSELIGIGKKEAFNTLQIPITTFFVAPEQIRIIVIDLSVFANLRMFNTDDTKNGWVFNPDSKWTDTGLTGGTIADEGWLLADKIFDVNLALEARQLVNFDFDTTISNNTENELAVIIECPRSLGFLYEYHNVILPSTALRDHNGLTMITEEYSEAHGGVLFACGRTSSSTRPTVLDDVTIPSMIPYGTAIRLLDVGTGMRSTGYFYTDDTYNEIARRISNSGNSSSNSILLPTSNIFITANDPVPTQIYHKQQARIFDDNIRIEYRSDSLSQLLANSQQDQLYWEISDTTANDTTIQMNLVSNSTVIESQDVKLYVSPIPTSPATSKNILIMGDSLSESYAPEIARRLVTTETPSETTIRYPGGYGLSNINFIGTKSDTHPIDPSLVVQNEGRYGWSWSTFAGSSSPFVQNGSLDFTSYGNVNGVPDVMIICLTWNAISPNGSISAAFESNFYRFMTELHKQWANTKVYLSAPPRSPLNGYIITKSGYVATQYGLTERDNHWQNQAVLYTGFEGENDWVKTFNIGASLHNTYGFGLMQPRFVNYRSVNSGTFIGCLTDIHPATIGMYSMADQVTNCICHYLANNT